MRRITRRELLRLAGGGAAALALSRLWADGPHAAAALPSRTIRRDGVILIDGKAFFPLGLYHDSLDADYYGEPFLRDLAAIAEGGFNLAHVSMDFTYDGTDAASSTAGRAARLAAEHGMYLAVAVYLKNLPAVVAEQARWPAILAASLGDDFNSDAKGRFAGPAKFPPSRLRELHGQVHRIAPNLLTYSSGSAYPKASLAGYEDAVDCIGIQCYPIGDGSQSVRNELEATDNVLANYWKLAGPKANKTVIANLQAFAWDGGRWPNPQEARLQAWVALLQGVRGLMWYSYLTADSRKPLAEARPALWEELKQLVAEVKRMREYLTEGTLHRIVNPRDGHFDDGEGTWHAGYWQLGGRRLVAAANTHRTQAIEVDLDVGGQGRLATPLAESRYGRSLAWRNGRLAGSLAPAGAEVYEVTSR